ncbi:hypothetical protein JCM10449v2_000112 [Rhodotorula kratochvilovae]
MRHPPFLPSSARLIHLHRDAHVGERCDVEWDLDTTGTWTSFSITLMTGSNLAMVPVQTVKTGLDGIKGATTLDYTCPNVTPNAAIYFHQFEPTSWTMRFTIAAADRTTMHQAYTVDGRYGMGHSFTHRLVWERCRSRLRGCILDPLVSRILRREQRFRLRLVVFVVVVCRRERCSVERERLDIAASLVVTATSTSSSSPA